MGFLVGLYMNIYTPTPSPGRPTFIIIIQSHTFAVENWAIGNIVE